MDLRGKHLKLATIQNYPLHYVIKENGSWVGKGVAFDIFNYVQKKHQFTYSVILPEEDVLGSESRGVISLLLKNEVDVGVGFFEKILFDLAGVPTSNTLAIMDWAILMKRPKESASGAGLSAPFEWEVWTLTLLTLIIVGPIMHYIISYRGRLVGDHQEMKTYSIFNCSWFVYGALIKQGSTLNPKSDTARILFATWWIFITILTSYYTANLTAYLTLSRFTLPINSLTDIGQKHYSWIARRGNIIESSMKNESSVFYKSLKGTNGHYVDATDNVLEKYVFDKNYIFLSEKTIVETMLYKDYLNRTKMDIEEEARCVFVITEWSFLKEQKTFGYSKNFKYAPLFNREFGQLVEAGIIQYKIRKHLPATEICPLNLGSKERKLKNTDLILTYYLVAGGYVIALMVFISENFLSLCKFNKDTKKTKLETKLASTFKEELPPLSYQVVLGIVPENEDRKTIEFNGRSYWTVKSKTGRNVLVPVRASSSILFHYTYYK